MFKPSSKLTFKMAAVGPFRTFDQIIFNSLLINTSPQCFLIKFRVICISIQKFKIDLQTGRNADRFGFLIGNI